MAGRLLLLLLLLQGRRNGKLLCLLLCLLCLLCMALDGHHILLQLQHVVQQDSVRCAAAGGRGPTCTMHAASSWVRLHRSAGAGAAWCRRRLLRLPLLPLPLQVPLPLLCQCSSCSSLLLLLFQLPLQPGGALLRRNSPAALAVQLALQGGQLALQGAHRRPCRAQLLLSLCKALLPLPLLLLQGRQPKGSTASVPDLQATQMHSWAWQRTIGG